MKKAIYTKKIGMTQYIDENGQVIPVTVLMPYKNEVLLKKTIEKNGYDSLVVGFEDIKEKHLNKPKIGFFKKLKKANFKFVRELRFENVNEFEQEDLNIEQFVSGDIVNVTSVSKGKGFQGTVKAHGFARGPMTHGSKNHRLPGSIGAGTDPARVYLGTKMAKRLGNKRVTIKGLKIVLVNKEENLVFIKVFK